MKIKFSRVIYIYTPSLARMLSLHSIIERVELSPVKLWVHLTTDTHHPIMLNIVEYNDNYDVIITYFYRYVKSLLNLLMANLYLHCPKSILLISL